MRRRSTYAPASERVLVEMDEWLVSWVPSTSAWAVLVPVATCVVLICAIETIDVGSKRGRVPAKRCAIKSPSTVINVDDDDASPRIAWDADFSSSDE